MWVAQGDYYRVTFFDALVAACENLKCQQNAFWETLTENWLYVTLQSLCILLFTLNGNTIATHKAESLFYKCNLATMVEPLLVKM